ncbi:MAG: SMP-30/gluconolactonase/LRE family protein [Candidatus Acidiferrales bacterium]
MTKPWASVSLVLLLVMTLAARIARAQTPDDKPVTRLDPTLDSLVSPDAKLEVVKRGFQYTEGTNWIQRGKTGYLLFSDIRAKVLYKMTFDAQGAVSVENAGYNGPIDGLTVDPKGGLVLCTLSGRSIDLIKKNGKHIVLATGYEGRPFGAPNDVVVKKDGAIYFTDPPSPAGRPGFSPATGVGGENKDGSKQSDFPGLYMIKHGKVTLVVNDMPTFNGLAFSNNEKYLYVNGNTLNYIRRYEVQRDDTLANGEMLIDMSADKSPGITDGMRVDSEGNIYESGPGGVWIITPEGKHLGTIRTPEKVTNITFGDADWKTLYVAARTTIYKIRVNVPGQPCNSCSPK